MKLANKEYYYYLHYYLSQQSFFKELKLTYLSIKFSTSIDFIKVFDYIEKKIYEQNRERYWNILRAMVLLGGINTNIDNRERFRQLIRESGELLGSSKDKQNLYI